MDSLKRLQEKLLELKKEGKQDVVWGVRALEVHDDGSFEGCGISIYDIGVNRENIERYVDELNIDASYCPGTTRYLYEVVAIRLDDILESWLT